MATGSLMARIYHVCIAVAFLVVLILAFVSLGTLADKHNEFLGACNAAKSDSPILSSFDCGCFLYSTSDTIDDMPVVRPGTGSAGNTCAFAIWGEAIVAVAALGLGLVALMKAILGKKVKSLFVLVELIILSITLLLDFIIAIIITAGLNQTCDAYNDVYSRCRDENAYGTERTISFFSAINSSRASAWVAFGIMGFLTIIYILVLVVYCRTRGKSDDETDSGRRSSTRKGSRSKSFDQQPIDESEEKPPKPI